MPPDPASPATRTQPREPKAKPAARKKTTAFEDWAARAPGILADARARAVEDKSYNPRIARAQIVSTFKDTFEGKRPHEWQVNVSEALSLGLSCLVIAATGAGKTMPFMMPLLADPTSSRVVIILSPLNELQCDQAARFRAAGLTATPVNREVYSKTLQKQIVRGDYRAILTSPEMCLKHPGFAPVMRSAEFMRKVFAIVVDEAHCIPQWKETFRQSFGDLIRLRSAAGFSTPILVTSATLTPAMVEDITRDLELARTTTYFVNLGNNRPNLVPVVHRMRGSATSLPILSVLVPKNPTRATSLQRAIVFFNNREQAQAAAMLLRDKVPAHLRDAISFLHAGRSAHARGIIMREFRAGNIQILCATEAAGMGLDIADIPLTIHFGIAPSAPVYTQRAGRAGRNGELAIAILLVEAAVFQTRRNPKAEEDTVGGGRKGKGRAGRVEDGESVASAAGNLVFRKAVEQGIREYVSTKGCRRDVMDRYYENPPRHAAQNGTFPCCDNCARSKETAGRALSEAEVRILDLVRQMSALDMGREDEEDGEDGDEEQDHAPGEEDVKPEKEVGRIGDRKATHLAECRRKLEEWKRDEHQRKYTACVFGEDTLLPPKVLTQLARQRRLKTPEDVLKALPGWSFGPRYAADLLGILRAIDERVDADRAREVEENRKLRRQRSEQNKIERNAARNESRRAARAAQKQSQAGPSNPLGTITYQTMVPLVPYAFAWAPFGARGVIS